MTGLRQPLHLVTKITVSHLRQLIHHCHWSVPCLCLLATAYPLVRPGPCDEPPHRLDLNPPTPPPPRASLTPSTPPSASLQLTFYIKKKERRRGTAIFNFTFLSYYHKILVRAQHRHSYRRNLIPLVIIPCLDLLMCSCMREKKVGAENNICFWILVFSPLIRYRTQKLLNGARKKGRKYLLRCKWYTVIR